MKRTLNFTGRKKLPADTVAVEIHAAEKTSGIHSFTARMQSLSDLGIDRSATIYLEAYTGAGITMRFCFGTLGAVVPPSDTLLSEINLADGVSFRLIVVDESTQPCRILASIDHVRPTREDEEQLHKFDLLPVFSNPDLGEELWRLVIQEPDRPKLLINSKVPFLLGRLVSNDPIIQGFVLPTVLRSILTYIYCDENIDEELDWVEHWRQFAEALSGSESPEISSDDGGQNEQLREFVEECVRKFCERQKYCSEVLLRAERENEN